MPIHLLWAPCIAHVDRIFLSRLMVLMHHSTEVLESKHYEERFGTLREEVARYSSVLYFGGGSQSASSTKEYFEEWWQTCGTILT